MQNAGTSATGTINTNARRKYPIVQLVAPETLSEGFTFDVEVNHEILTVVVPHGGVRKGQPFRAQTQARIQDERSTIRIPVGGWKDSLFDFCRYGPFHPSICLAVCCPLIALGQIYTRLNLNWHGQPNENEYESAPISNLHESTNAPPPFTTPPEYSSRAFKIMVAFSIVYGVLTRMIAPENFALIHLSNFLFLLVCAILIGRTRTQIRNRYEIQATTIEETAERCGCRNLEDSVPMGCDVVEDYVVSCVCAPCAVSQMSRHTAPYDTYEGSCFSSNGLPRHAPAVV